MITATMDKVSTTWWMATNKNGEAVIGKREHEVRIVAKLAKSETAYRIFDVTGRKKMEINKINHGCVTWLDDPEDV